MSLGVTEETGDHADPNPQDRPPRQAETPETRLPPPSGAQDSPPSSRSGSPWASHPLPTDHPTHCPTRRCPSDRPTRHPPTVTPSAHPPSHPPHTHHPHPPPTHCPTCHPPAAHPLPTHCPPAIPLTIPTRHPPTVPPATHPPSHPLPTHCPPTVPLAAHPLPTCHPTDRPTHCPPATHPPPTHRHPTHRPPATHPLSHLPPTRCATRCPPTTHPPPSHPPSHPLPTHCPPAVPLSVPPTTHPPSHPLSHPLSPPATHPPSPPLGTGAGADPRLAGTGGAARAAPSARGHARARRDRGAAGGSQPGAAVGPTQGNGTAGPGTHGVTRGGRRGTELGARSPLGQTGPTGSRAPGTRTAPADGSVGSGQDPHPPGQDMGPWAPGRIPAPRGRTWVRGLRAGSPPPGKDVGPWAPGRIPTPREGRGSVGSGQDPHPPGQDVGPWAPGRIPTPREGRGSVGSGMDPPPRGRTGDGGPAPVMVRGGGEQNEAPPNPRGNGFPAVGSAGRSAPCSVSPASVGPGWPPRTPLCTGAGALRRGTGLRRDRSRHSGSGIAGTAPPFLKPAAGPASDPWKQLPAPSRAVRAEPCVLPPPPADPKPCQPGKERSGRMESQPAANGHATPLPPAQGAPGAAPPCRPVPPCAWKAAAGDVSVPGGSGEPSGAGGSIAGVYVGASKKAMSFYDATREHLLSWDVALCFLEAQAATGAIADPARGRRVSVAEATRLGLVGPELRERLGSAEKAAAGFADPYTGEKICLYQAMRKELIGRERGARLLEAQLATGGIVDPVAGCRLPVDVACARGCLDEEVGRLLAEPGAEDGNGFLDPSTMERVAYAELMKACVIDPASGFLLLPLEVTFAGLGGRVRCRDLLEAGVVGPEVFRDLEEGRVSAQEVGESDSVRRFLRGTGSVAGVVLPSGERKSLYQALREHLLAPGAALALLQAQASTGSLTDPVRNKSYSVAEAVRVGLVGPELHETLCSAERAVSGYRDPRTGEVLSLLQAVRAGFIPEAHGMCLLEAQMATGGVIAPGRHLRVPPETACERGYLDEATRRLLSSPTEDTKGFFDPVSREKLSYAALLERCVTDPRTGLLLLPLGDGGPRGPEGNPLFLDRRTRAALENTQVPVAPGTSQGKSVSLWKLLFSDRIPGEHRAALTQRYLAGTLSTRELAAAVSAAIEEAASAANVTFEGLRDRVTAAQLLSAEIINRDLFDRLREGETSAEEVVGMDTVRKYLRGTGSIGGLLLPDSQERMSIYQAKRKGLLRPGTSLILLEAQAATGFIVDPAANKRYSVEEALRANVIGPDVYDKLLTAEKAVTGYRDPASGSTISLFQAMQKGLIVREHGIRLLEAQIATGGIIDPVHSHRIPVEVAYRRGYFDKKMNLILSDPGDDTKGFFDPNTHENLTYLQLKEKCITEPDTGLCLLPLNSAKRQFVDDATRRAFRSSWLPVRFGRLRGEKVSVWDLLNSEYLSEGKRREIINHFQLRKLSLEQVRAVLAEEAKRWAPIRFPALRGSVSAYHLMETGVIGKALFEELLEGSVTPEEVLRTDSIRRYLCGAGSVGGVVLQPSNQRMSIYEAMKRNMVVPGVALPLLEAQAATGFIIDPVNNRKLRVDDAVRAGVVGPEVHEKLRHAEGAVTGYKDPFTGKRIPLFQAMKKGLVADKQAMQLLEVQVATGGIVDPACGHYVPVEVAQQRGCLDEDTSKALSEPGDNSRAFCVPDGKETVTYAELIQRCQKDESSGFHLLPLPQTAAPARTNDQIRQIFKETVVKEKGVSLWELIHSGYFTEEQRSEFVETFRAEEASLQQLIERVLGRVREMELRSRSRVTLEGSRGGVPAVWLLDAGIIPQQTFEELAWGVRTPEEVAAEESVKRYLQGTGSIAGVFVEASKRKMSFYEAMKSNLLLPGAALRLLEAQAATGYLTDPATSRRLSVRDAVRAGLVGEELSEKLLLAERAASGYADPYTGSSISLCQALRKELIPLAEAVPLLEAQLAAGGVMDPVHHHHLPLQAARRYGFYDDDLHQTLSRLDDTTRVFLDPNTKENVTYQQLKDRCVREADSGLWLLPLSEDAMFCADEGTAAVLRAATVCVNVGRFKGQTVSVWDLLNSEYFSDGRRRELVQRYKAESTEVLREITATVTAIIEETEAQGTRFAFKGLRKRVSASDLFQSQLIDKKTLDELSQGKKTVEEVTEMDSVRRYLEGSNFIAGVLVRPSNEKMSIYQAMRKGILRPGTALVLLEAQAATGFVIDPENNRKFSVEEALSAGLIGGEIFEKLLCAERAVTGYADPYTKAPMSLFEAMNRGLIVKSHGIRLLEAQIATGGIIDPVHSHRIPVEVAYRRGYFDREMNRILSDPGDDTKGFFDPNTHENLTYRQLLERCVPDSETGLYMLQVVQEGGKYLYIEEATKQALRSQPLEVKVGKFKDQAVSVWEILCSHYISEQRRRELVTQYQCQTLALEDLAALVLATIEEAEQSAGALKVKGLRGDVSVSELFDSEIIDEKTLDQLQAGSLPLASLAKRDTVRRYLEGTGCIAGVLLPSRKERMSIYQALRRGLLMEQCALALLEAQAATGFLVDPLANKKLSVAEAVAAGLVGSELQEKLLAAERAVTGYAGPQTGEKISLFQAIRQKMVVREHGVRLLEAQLATGGIVDPVHSHRLPVEVAYRRGCLDDDMFVRLSDPDHGYKGFTDPNTQEKISYGQLLQRCAKDRATGLPMLQVAGKDDDYFYIDEQTKAALASTKVQVPVGKWKGCELSLWELLFSEYITEEKRQELVKQYKERSNHVLRGIVDTILGIIREKEEGRSDIWFQGLRQQITASELLSAQIITEETMEKLHEGKETAQEIAQMASVRRYLEGTGCIAGVLVPSKADPAKPQKMSIYQAMGKGVLRQGTGLVLLEAQAATGFLVDPLANKKLSVAEAVAAGLVGSELQEKLLAAERAVTGYTDPYTGRQISLFQAMQKELIVREHGIRLLEAQIATGGIVDPVHSHRLPVEAAYRRGYFDRDMNRVLSDPGDDTKGFFDPNTHENLTYLQLLQRCVPDPDTGLYFLQVFRFSNLSSARGASFHTWNHGAGSRTVVVTGPSGEAERRQSNPRGCDPESRRRPRAPTPRRPGCGANGGRFPRFLGRLLTNYCEKAVTQAAGRGSGVPHSLERAGTAGEAQHREGEGRGSGILSKPTTAYGAQSDVVHGGRTRAAASPAEQWHAGQSARYTNRTLDPGPGWDRVVLQPQRAPEAPGAGPRVRGARSCGPQIKAPTGTNRLHTLRQHFPHAGTTGSGPGLGLQPGCHSPPRAPRPLRTGTVTVLGCPRPGHPPRRARAVGVSWGPAGPAGTLPLPVSFPHFIYFRRLNCSSRSPGVRLIPGFSSAAGERASGRAVLSRPGLTPGSTRPERPAQHHQGQRSQPEPLPGRRRLGWQQRPPPPTHGPGGRRELGGHPGRFIVALPPAAPGSCRGKPLPGIWKPNNHAPWEGCQVPCSSRESLADPFPRNHVPGRGTSSAPPPSPGVGSQDPPSRGKEPFCLLVAHRDLPVPTPRAWAGWRVPGGTRFRRSKRLGAGRTGGPRAHGALRPMATSRGRPTPVVSGQWSAESRAGLHRRGGVTDCQHLRGVRAGTAPGGSVPREKGVGVPLPGPRPSPPAPPNSLLPRTDLSEPPGRNSRTSRRAAAGRGVTPITSTIAAAAGVAPALAYARPSASPVPLAGVVLRQPAPVPLLGCGAAGAGPERAGEQQVGQSPWGGGGRSGRGAATRPRFSVADGGGLQGVGDLASPQNPRLGGGAEVWGAGADTTPRSVPISAWAVPGSWGRSHKEGQSRWLSSWGHGMRHSPPLLGDGCSRGGAPGFVPPGSTRLWPHPPVPGAASAQGLRHSRAHPTGHTESWTHGTLPGGQDVKSQPAPPPRAGTPSTMALLAFPSDPSPLAGAGGGRGAGGAAPPAEVTPRRSRRENPCPNEPFLSLCPARAGPRRSRRMQKSDRPPSDEAGSAGSDLLAGGHGGWGGGNFVAGVFLQAKREKMSIYQAMTRGLLTPGTGLVLLEAQAAAGVLTDPVRNERLSVKEALAAGLVGRDVYEKLLSAEGAVTGYAEPYTGRRISLFQAMQKELIVREHGIRLLEAQIATGGIVDPVHSHRLPVEAAYRRGYLDEEMCRWLSDPENQTRSCFDPNTHENLTYRQLLQRCVPDPDTGLLMLQLAAKGSVLSQLSQDARKALQAARTTLGAGLFQGQSVTAWELLFSRYVPERRRQDLLRQYKAGTLSVSELVALLADIVAGAEGQGHAAAPAHRPTAREAPAKAENGDARGSGTKLSLWELLFSKYVPEHRRQDLLRQYKAGTVTVSELVALLADIVAGAETEIRDLSSPAVTPGEVGASHAVQDTPPPEQQLRKSLKAATVCVTAGEFRGQDVPLLDVLFSKHIPQGKRQELLELYRAGILTTEQVAAAVTVLVNRAGAANAALAANAGKAHPAGMRAAEDGGGFSTEEAEQDNALKATTVRVPAGELQGRRVSLWDLLLSDHIPEEKREELLELYRERVLTLEQMITVVTTLVKKKQSTGRKFLISVKTSDTDTRSAAGKDDDPPREEPWETALKTTVVDVEVGEFGGRKVSVWDLLHSRYIPEENRKELLELFRAGELTLEQVKTVTCTIVTRAGAEQVGHAGSARAQPEAVGAETTHPRDETWEETLRSTRVEAPWDELQGRRVSLWDLLFSDHIPEEKREELLELHRAGTLSTQELLSTARSIATRCKGGRHATLPRQTLDLLRSEGSYITVGRFQEQRVSVWELLATRQVSEYKREAHLDAYGTAGLTVNKITVTTTVITGPQREEGPLREPPARRRLLVPRS
ncbi:epiplakin [Rhynochetos jubatus]